MSQSFTKTKLSMIYTSIKKIHDPIERERVVSKLMTLRAQLDREIPKKTASSTLTVRSLPTVVENDVPQFSVDRKSVA